MSLEIGVVFGLILLAIPLFTTEIFSFEVTGLIITGILMVSNILTVQGGLSGLSNEATVTIASIFVVSEGLRQTGVLRGLGSLLEMVGQKGFGFAAITIMVIISISSGFINNTATVAIFIPIVINLSHKSPSKLLIPLSFASIAGGVCTLMGTSTDILVNSIAKERSVRGFSIFDFLPQIQWMSVLGNFYLQLPLLLH